MMEAAAKVAEGAWSRWLGLAADARINAGCGLATAGLFVGDTHLFNHARIFGELIAGHDTQFLGRSTAHRETQILKLVANLGIADRPEGFGVQPGDDLLRGAGRRHDRKPGIEEETGQARLRNGGYIGKLRQALLRGHPDQPDLTAAHQRRNGPKALEADR